MSYARTDEDLGLTSGKRMAASAEIARRQLASSLRIEDLLSDLISLLSKPPATLPEEASPEAAPSPTFAASKAPEKLEEPAKTSSKRGPGRPKKES